MSRALKQDAGGPHRAAGADWLQLVPVAEGDGLTILRSAPANAVDGPPIVVFSSNVKPNKRAEFLGTIAKTERPALFLSTRRRTWFAEPAMVALATRTIQREIEQQGADAVDTIGFSMGAFAACAYAEVVPVRHAVAFAPRWSIGPQGLKDRRNRPVLDRLGNRIKFSSLQHGIDAAGSVLVVHGSRGPDLPHLDHFARCPGFDHWILPGVGHEVAGALHARDQLSDIAVAALNGDGDLTATLLRAAGAAQRDSRRAKRAIALGRVIYAARGIIGYPRTSLNGDAGQDG